MIKLLALDMDGTLLNSAKKISKTNIEAIHKAIKKGVQLVLCTGRPLFGVKPYYEQLGLVEKNGFAIVNNGCSIHETLNWDLIDWEELTLEDIQFLESLAKQSQVQLTLIDEEHYFVLGGAANSIIEADAKLVFTTPTEISLSDIKKHQYTLFQAMFLGTESQVDDFESRFAHIIANRFSGVRSQPVIYEAMPSGITKASALARLAQKMGLESNEVMAIGDADNDIEMLEFAGLSIAMGNASNHVKQFADYITDSNDNHGVAKAIEKHILA
ncbi:Hydrolase (HAD superfamily) [Streptococcus sp. DD10]|uniref:Cof-type HAD-IIB family hydrolase n=1 Tax=Streptococcus sp. DD10 TaxID=1777878 RepID=UPI000798512A|nr:Cof-type HAD-IIB family hydrolase [Streptococcus sp. DD10]KXT75000.1 Hydrolase (HAD superfamily) [Streptococcus sp. DD10]